MIKVDNRDALAALERMDAALGDFTPALNKVAKVIEDSIEKNFDAQGRPDKWKNLHSEWAEWKRKKGFATKVLQMTGTLKTSFKRLITKKRAFVYTEEPQAARHNFGFETTPANPFLVLQPDEEQKIVNIIADHPLAKFESRAIVEK